MNTKFKKIISRLIFFNINNNNIKKLTLNFIKKNLLIRVIISDNKKTVI